MEETMNQKAYTEVYEIIENLDEQLKTKIPKKLIGFLRDNRDLDYKFEFDKNIDINEQDLEKDTQILLAIIYKDYLCTEEEKKEIIQIMNENEIKYQKELEEKYSTENIFQKRLEKKEKVEIVEEIQKVEQEKNQLQEYKENQNLIKRILKKFLNFFNINRK